MPPCNGHGYCDDTLHQKWQKCICSRGWGAEEDIMEYKAPDCSQAGCPVGKAFFSLASSATQAHEPRECSNAGLCDRATGMCTCFPGHTGEACEFFGCGDTGELECSGHGVCRTMEELAQMENAVPVQASTTTYGSPSTSKTTTWDQDQLTMCVCDSAWEIGLGAGQVQNPQWFGPACTMKHCPSGDDPYTYADETDCEGVNGGAAGNLCHVDCANRGYCDYNDGTCYCFTGFKGIACTEMDAMAVSAGGATPPALPG